MVLIQSKKVRKKCKKGATTYAVMFENVQILFVFPNVRDCFQMCSLKIKIILIEKRRLLK